jgi:hypothetical protein
MSPDLFRLALRLGIMVLRFASSDIDAPDHTNWSGVPIIINLTSGFWWHNFVFYSSVE